MHKYLLLSFLLLLSLASCKKSSEKSTNSRLVGKWTYVALTERNYTSTGTPIDKIDYPLKSVDYIEFKSDGTWIEVFGGNPSSGTYSVTSDSRFELINNGIDNPCRIQTLSANQLTFVLEGPKRGNDNYKEFTHTLQR